MKAKIIKAFLTVISVLLISEAFFLVMHYAIAGKYQEITDRLVSEYQLTEKSSDLVNSFYDLIQYSNDQKRINAFNDNLEGLNALLAKLDRDLYASESWPVYLGTKNTLSVVMNDVTKGLDSISAGNFSEVTADYLKAAKDNNFVRENTSNLVLKELEAAEKTHADITRTKFWSEIFGLILLIGVALGSVLYALSFTKKITERLRRLAEFAKKLGPGKYEEKMDDGLKRGKDEIATLANSIDSLKASVLEQARKTSNKEMQISQLRKNLADQAAPPVHNAEEEKPPVPPVA